MKTVASLRVSTAQQDVRSQRLALLEYARHHDVRIDAFIEATASGQASDKRRRLDELLHLLQRGDRVVVSALSRLGRSLGQIVAILDALATADVAFVALKEHIRVEGTRDIQTKVMTTLFALFAEVERDLISERTREGLARARASGKQRGRPKGALGVSRLDGKEDDIRRFLELGVSKTAIATITGVSRPSLYSFMSTRGLKPSPSRVFLHESCRCPVLDNPAPPSPVHAGDGLVGQEARAPVAAELLHESPALGAQTHRRSFKMTKMAKMINMPRSNTRECSSLSGLSGLSGALGDGRSATRRPACSRGEDWTPAEPGPH